MSKLDYNSLTYMRCTNSNCGKKFKISWVSGLPRPLIYEINFMDGVKK